MRSVTLTPAPTNTPSSAKANTQFEAGITRAEIEEYFLYDSIDPLNRKRRMSRRMASHLRKIVSQPCNESIAKMVLPPGWFDAIHKPIKASEVTVLRLLPVPHEVESMERHREVIEARHRAVMRLVALEQAKGGANR